MSSSRASSARVAEREPRVQGDGGAAPRGARERRARRSSTCSRRSPSPATRRRRSRRRTAPRSRSTRESFSWRGRAATARRARSGAARALPLDRKLQLLRAGRGARGPRERCPRDRRGRVRRLLGRRRRAARRVPRRARDPRPRGERPRRGVRGGGAQPVPRARPVVLGGHGGADPRARPLGCGPRAPRGRRAVELPFEVADYVDFYSSLEHATNLGRLFRPGRRPACCRTGATFRSATTAAPGPSSSAAPRSCARRGQTKAPRRRRATLRAEPAGSTSSSSSASSSASGAGSASPCPTSAFRDHVFGVVLVNDWSARDIQAWEYQPLGPFLGKSFATSIGAWVTPLALLEDRFVPSPGQDPEPLPYLRTSGDWALDVELEVELSGTVVSRTNARGLYWTMPQQLAHATVNGASIAHGRPLRVRHDLRAGARQRGIAHRADVERRASDRARGRFDADVPRGRRRGRPARSGRASSSSREVRGTILPAARQLVARGKRPAR